MPLVRDLQLAPDGLPEQLTKTVLETALHEEMTEHLGYEKYGLFGAGAGNIRYGTRAKDRIDGQHRLAPARAVSLSAPRVAAPPSRRALRRGTAT